MAKQPIKAKSRTATFRIDSRILDEIDRRAKAIKRSRSNFLSLILAKEIKQNNLPETN
jgi:predicted transcriptional regulator